MPLNNENIVLYVVETSFDLGMEDMLLTVHFVAERSLEYAEAKHDGK